MKVSELSVTSHVSRDFLQGAAVFNSLPKVAWEYISNSLDNAKEDTPARVVVDLDGSRCLRIADNGSGMSREDLRQFFQMHGVNPKRSQGKRVRGQFGTGKSAAFGIATELKLDTVKEGRRNVVQLTREAIDTAIDGGPFPVEPLIVDEATTEEDGTIVEISGFKVPRLDLEQMIAYVERNLARYQGRPTVVINGHTCKFREPPSIMTFERTPPPSVTAEIGDVVLKINVSPLPLGKDDNGIDVLSKGNWHETTLAEVAGEHKDRLFGEVDVPCLEDEEGPIPAFDNTRNGQLNRANTKVVVLLAWIHDELEAVRRLLVERDRERRKTEEAKRLAEEAKRLEQILNEDFARVMDEFELARRVSSRQKLNLQETGGSKGEMLPGGGDHPTPWQEAAQEHGGGNGGDTPPGEGNQERPGPSLVPGSQPGTPKEATTTLGKRRRGLFSISFDHLTPEHSRSKYDRETRTIHINLDHPQVAAVLRDCGGALDARQFLDMAYEIAGVEYAQAIQFERIVQGQEVDPEDALFSVGETIDRISRRFAEALASGAH